MPIRNIRIDANGNYSFTGLPPGKYKLNIPGEPTKTILIGKDGIHKGQLDKPVEKGVTILPR